MEMVPMDIRDTVQKYIQTFPARLAAGDGLVLIGNVGSGKTSILALLAVSAPLGTQVKFTTMNRLFDDLFQVGRRNDENTARSVEEMYEAQYPLLLLDDIGTEYAGAELAMTRFHQLMEHRYANRLSTCISTNLSAEVLKTRIPRIYDRLAERGVCAVSRQKTQRQRVSVADWQREIDESVERGDLPWQEEQAAEMERSAAEKRAAHVHTASAMLEMHGDRHLVRTYLLGSPHNVAEDDVDGILDTAEKMQCDAPVLVQR